VPNIPTDVKKFLEEAKKRGLDVDMVAVMKSPPPNEKYDVWVDSNYVGEAGPDEVFGEEDVIICGKLTCTLFKKDTMKLLLDRLKNEILEPEEF